MSIVAAPAFTFNFVAGGPNTKTFTAMVGSTATDDSANGQPQQSLKPQPGQHWACVIWNMTNSPMMVFSDENGSMWVPAFTAGRLAGCETCRLTILVFNGSPGFNNGGTFFLNWAIEPDDLAGAYPLAGLTNAGPPPPVT